MSGGCSGSGGVKAEDPKRSDPNLIARLLDWTAEVRLDSTRLPRRTETWK